MLRVGLTGGLGSGKSTAASLFAAHGAHILSSDEIARTLMHPDSMGSVYPALVEHFGPAVVRPDGLLDRTALARIAFQEGRAEELNAIIHPATIAHQTDLSNEIAARGPHAIVIVESALIFETKYGETRRGGESAWHHRFDKLILVTAPEEQKIARFIARMSPIVTPSPENRAILEAEARRRLALQLPDEQKSALCDYVLTNSGPLTELQWQVDRLWPLLLAAGQLTT